MTYAHEDVLKSGKKANLKKADLVVLLNRVFVAILTPVYYFKAVTIKTAVTKAVEVELSELTKMHNVDQQAAKENCISRPYTEKATDYVDQGETSNVLTKEVEDHKDFTSVENNATAKEIGIKGA